MPYVCLHCREEIDELERPRCPFCGFRIVAKKSPAFARRVNSR